MTPISRLCSAALLFAASHALPAHAVDLRVLSAGAVEPGMRTALAAFERESGHRVQIGFSAAPALRAALRAAPVADLIVAPEAVLAEAASAASGATTTAAGASSNGLRAPIGRVGVGIAVRAGADAPDVGNAEALKVALGSADAVVFNRASTGVYVETMLQKLGVADAVTARSVRVADGAAVMRQLLAGTGRRELGFAAMTEIVLFKDQGIRLVGPLPAALQNYTSYVAVPWPGSVRTEPERVEAIAALMRHLQGSEARSAFANAGIEPTH